MGERKVLNKYYPPDFDPSQILRKKGTRKDQIKVRMMLPMSIRCNTCGNFIYKGTKFNSRKEDAAGEEYLGIMVYRFYFKCPRCSAELVMKTDPKNSDYVVEAGASRNYEPWKDADAQVEAALKQREDEETGDAMRALENRTAASKREMDINNALDELRSMNNRHASVAIDDVLAAVRRKEEEEAQMFNAQVEEAARRAFRAPHGPGPSAGVGIVRRIDDDDDDGGEDAGAGAAAASKRARTEGHGDAQQQQQQQSKAAQPSRPQVLFAVKRREAPPPAAPAEEKPDGGNPLAGLAAYGSSEDE